MEMVKEFEHMIYIPLKVERSNHQITPIFYTNISVPTNVVWVFESKC